MASEHLYSRIIYWLKIVLPLLALAILSGVVFFARESEDRREVPFLTDTGEPLPGEAVSNPEFQSATMDGTTVKFTAKTVSPDGPDRLTGQNLTGRIETREGRVLQANAPSGWIDRESRTAGLSGIVSVDTSDGFSIITEGLTTRLDRTLTESTGGVRGEAPFGTLQAGSMRLVAKVPDDATGPDEGGDVLVFNGGVKLIYQPDREGSTP